jgi:hypothetical protein
MNGVATESLWSPESSWSAQSSTEQEAQPFEALGTPTEAGYELESPFLSATSFGEQLGEPLGEQPSDGPLARLESPFLSGFAPVAQEDRQADTFRQLLAELEDESFEEAVAQLVDEAAGQYLAAEASWSAGEAAPSLALGELERWIEPLATEMDRLIDEVGSRLAAEDFESLRESELDTLLESVQPEAGSLPEAFQQFMGGFFNKVRGAVKGAWNLAKSGAQALGRVVPIGWFLSKLRELGPYLIRRVVQSASGIKSLPAQLQPIARTLAARLSGRSEVAGESESPSFEDGGLAREFDVQLASLMLAPTESEAENLIAEVEAEANQELREPLTELDAARARLAEQLAELPAGEAPVAELEQFIPAVMAALPAIRLGIKVLGRDKFVGLLAGSIAGPLSENVGHAAATAIARPIADRAFATLGLESTPSGEASLGGEALVSTVEDTVRQLLELPAEAFEDPLRLEAELQQAFAEAAARHVPAELLRPDLPEHETAGEGGVWILMPRATRPRFRYKKYTRVFVVPISRQAARAIATTDGGTLEAQLLDRGVVTWPAEGEVHLYETLPGAQLGQIAQFEADEGSSLAETLEELQPLTPEAASLLLREPGLGRRLAPGTAPGQPPHGRRYYRVNLPGQLRRRMARPRRRFRVEVDSTQRSPRVRVHLRLSEREGQHLAQQLDQGALPRVVAWLKERYRSRAPAVLAARLLRSSEQLLRRQLTHQAAERLGEDMTEALTRALTRHLRTRHHELAAAVRDPAQGVTITFLFGVSQPVPTSGSPFEEPSVAIHPGWRPPLVRVRPAQPLSGLSVGGRA